YVPDDSEPVLILELIEEHDTLLDLAAEAQRTRRPFSAKHAWQILEQLFDALEHCHHRGVLHLDLNPSNIVIRSIEGNPRFVQLLDFGLARQSESQEPPPPAGAATSIAPEVLTGEVPDERADVYGAGLLACMLLLWQSPFHGQNQEQILAHKRGREGSSFDLLPSIDTPFEEALRRSLSVGPSGRTRTIAHLRAELGAAMKT
ncbi:MAG: protein kinase, partial [Myxococcales bacterium]|nr:protein kinase [Myxococcales bacterium]